LPPPVLSLSAPRPPFLRSSLPPLLDAPSACRQISLSACQPSAGQQIGDSLIGRLGEPSLPTPTFLLPSSVPPLLVLHSFAPPFLHSSTPHQLVGTSACRLGSRRLVTRSVIPSPEHTVC